MNSAAHALLLLRLITPPAANLVLLSLSLFSSVQVIADAVGSVGAPVSMDKMVYLSERMFYQEGTTDAGYLDQCARLRNQLGGMTQVHMIYD